MITFFKNGVFLIFLFLGICAYLVSNERFNFSRHLADGDDVIYQATIF